MDCSFTPDGHWFAFDDTGRTLRSGFKTKRQAVSWIYERLYPPKPRNPEMAKKPSKPPSKPMSYGKPKGKGGKGGRSC